MRRYDQKYIRGKNQSRILELLYKSPKSRAQVAKTLHLTASTVSDITSLFLEKQILYEGDAVIGNVGKRPKLLYFNKDFFYFVGLVITSAEINCVLCNLAGDIQKEDSAVIPASSTAKEIVDLAFRMTDRLLSGLERDKLMLLSLGSPETVNLETGRIRFAPYVQDWIGTDLASLFRKRYGVETILKDHVKLETLGEQWKNYGQVQNLVYIVITRGIGSGAIIDGKIREGRHGYLGEIAYLPIGEKLEQEELRRRAKGLGHFEAQCDIKHIEEVVRDLLSRRGLDAGSLGFEKIAELYGTDAEVRNTIDTKVITTLSLGIAAVITMLDPEIVVINGEIIQLGKHFLELLNQKVFNIIPHRAKILYSTLQSRARIYGAISNALEHLGQLLQRDPQQFYRIDYVKP